ncbi:hypothetical protein D3C74_418390 [compost metagenome]
MRQQHIAHLFESPDHLDDFRLQLLGMVDMQAQIYRRFSLRQLFHQFHTHLAGVLQRIAGMDPDHFYVVDRFQSIKQILQTFGVGQRIATAGDDLVDAFIVGDIINDIINLRHF